MGTLITCGRLCSVLMLPLNAVGWRLVEVVLTA